MNDKLSWFTSIYNWFDLFGLVSIFLIIVIQMGSQLCLQKEPGILGHILYPFNDMIAVENMRIMAAIASFCVIANMFDWLRIFDATGFYIILLTETMKDIRAFIILVFVSLLLFGVPLTMLNLNRTEDTQVVEPVFGHWFLNMILG